MMPNLSFNLGYLDIHDNVIMRYTQEGGEVANLVNTVTQRAWSNARAVAYRHWRSGKLFNGLMWDRTKPTGPYECTGRLHSTARHTLWFNDGTPAIIQGSGAFMTLKPHPPRYPYPIRKKEVRGQAGTQFLQHSINRAMRTI